MPVPNFLNKDQMEKLPEGGQFSPTGLVGLWMGGHAYTFHPNDSNEAEAVEQGVGPDDTRFGWWIYKKYEDAQEAIKTMDIRNALNGKSQKIDTVWRFEARLDTVLNLTNKSKWNDPVTDQVVIKTFDAFRHRHELHLVSLPAAVAAMATAYGYDNPGFDLSELCDSETAFTDEFFEKMCGSPELKSAKVFTAQANGTLIDQRKALWAALGEDDWTKYKIPVEGESGRYDTTAPKLQDCLGILVYTWREPVWARLISVFDPHVNAIAKNSGNRLKIPCITQVFSNRAEAEASVAEEAEQGEEPIADTGAGPVVPAPWANFVNDFKAEVDKFKLTDAYKEAMGRPVPLRSAAVQAAIEGYENFGGCNPSEVAAWL